MNINTTETKYEKLNEYFKLKSKYESQFDKEKKKIVNSKNMSWKEKRSLFKEFKPKCIVCKRPVGNIFTIIKEPEQHSRTFKATCGDLVSPCGFNYIIKVDDCSLYTEDINMLEEEIKNIKDKIIKYKNGQLFGYIDNDVVIEEFDKMKEILNDSSTLLEHNLTEYNKIVDNKTKNETISKLKMDIYNNYINNIKISMNEFDKTNDVQFVRDVVDIYVNTLTPKLKELSDLEFSKSFVEFNSDTNTYHLIQKKTDISNLEDYYSVEVVEENLSANLDKTKKSKKGNEPKKAPIKETKKKAPVFILEDTSS